VKRIERFSPKVLLAIALALLSASTAFAAPVDDRRATLDAIDAMARHAGLHALGPDGQARGDYDTLRGTWHVQEPAWHTGQLVLGLLQAHAVTGDARHLDAARRGGEWWMAQRINEGPLTGMLNAAHRDRLGALINFSTVSDGSAGMYALSAATNDPRYAQAATDAAAWSLKHLYSADDGLVLNIVDPTTGSAWTDRSPHHESMPASRTQVARPNIEGSLFLDASRQSGDAALRDAFRAAFLRTLDAAVATQHGNGLWMDFEPNDPGTGAVHPRFNLWYAEALLEGYALTKDVRYREAALRALRATARLHDADGSAWYETRDPRYAGNAARAKRGDAPAFEVRRESITGSATAFAGLVMLQARRLTGTREFDARIEAARRWVVEHRYPEAHPDPALAGSLLELRRRRGEGGTLSVRARPIATAFGLRFLAAYATEKGWQGADATADAAFTALPLAHLPARRKQTLDGEWRYIVDPFEVGITKPRPPRRSITLDQRANALENPLIEYEWDTARKIQVPGDWNTQETELHLYEGMLWYHRRIRIDDLRAGERQFLYFEAANYRTRAWLNGEAIGEHAGGFTPFQFEVTGKLKPEAENVLVIAVDAGREPEGVPAMDFDWFNYGGLTRSLHVVHVPATHLGAARVALQADGRLALSARVEGRITKGALVRFAMPGLGVEVDAPVDAQGRASTTADPGAFTAWSPTTPTLYAVEASLRGATGDITDRITDRVGLRRIEVRGADLFLNGQRLFLRGISLHEERFGAAGGRLRTNAEARALLQAAKDLGANFVRLAHYPHGEATTRLADEMGLLVWSEIPVYWDEIRYGHPATLALARRTQAVNIDRDFNRASIILWSVANETSITPARNAFLRRLVDDTRAFDGTRLVTAALNKAQSSGDEIRIVDPLAGVLDVISVNQYEGWYGQRSPAQITGLSFTSDFDKPFVFSEFGADAPRTFRAAKEVRWSADYQRWLYEQNLALFDTMPGLDGLSPWILKDFRVPRRWHGRFQDYWNRKGLLDEEGERKPAFETLRGWYERRAASEAQSAE
jgi:beta-glucuronidase